MRIFLKILLTATALLVVVAFGAMYWFSTADYRDEISQLVADSTGYQLNIAGDLDLNLFPNPGLVLNDVRLRNPAAPQELLSAAEVVVRFNMRELFQGHLAVDEQIARDLHINYYVNADGSSIWDVDTPVTADSGESAGASGSILDNISVARLAIENTSLDYQDLAQGTRYQIDDLNLETRDANLAGRPFAVEIRFDFGNNGMSEPVPVSLRSNVLVDLDGGNLNFNDLALSLTPMLLQGEVSVVKFDRNAQFSGNLAAPAFDLNGLLQNLGMAATEAEIGSGSTAGQSAAFSMEFSGNQSEATIPSFTIGLGDAEIEANGSLRYGSSLEPISISYSAIGGDIDLTPFISSGDDNAAEEPDTTTAEDIPLPLEALQSFNLLGSISLASVTADDLRFEGINLFTNIEDGVLDLELTPAGFFDGTVQGALRVDSSASTPALSTQFATDSVNLSRLAPMLSRFSTVTGNLNLQADHQARGASVNSLLDTLSGSTSFTISDNSVDISLVKQVFTAIAALSPTGEAIQQWPDVIRFNEMGGYLVLEEGLSNSQQIKLRMDNFDVTGSGGFSLREGDFDYDLLFTVLGDDYTQTIPINELYHNVSWPVQCAAEFDAPLSQYCSPDFEQVRQIFAQIGTNAARNRLQEVITDQVPEELQDSARGLLRNILN